MALKRLTYREALVFYDGLQVFVADDQYGAKYICTLVEQAESLDKYLCVPVSLRHLYDLINAELDLRTIYDNAEMEHYFTIESKQGQLDDLTAAILSREEVPSSWLPEQEFYLKIQSISDQEILAEATKRSRAVINCRLNPPEAISEPKIYADNLSQATKLIQRLVKYAFRRSIRVFDKEIRGELREAKNYQLEIFGFSPGSFTLHMQSAAPADLVGYSEIIKALEIIDNVTRLANVPNETVEYVSQLGGHFAATYKDLLRFISESETHFEYEWASPDRASTVKRGISSSQAIPLYEALSERTDIGIEKVILVGKLTKVDEKLKTWRIINESDDKEYSGSSEIDMAGLVIETQKYELSCQERLEEERGTGREYTKLYLTSIRRL